MTTQVTQIEVKLLAFSFGYELQDIRIDFNLCGFENKALSLEIFKIFLIQDQREIPKISSNLLWDKECHLVGYIKEVGILRVFVIKNTNRLVCHDNKAFFPGNSPCTFLG